MYFFPYLSGQVYFIDGEAVAYDPEYKADKERIAGENCERRREMMRVEILGHSLDVVVS